MAIKRWVMKASNHEYADGLRANLGCSDMLAHTLVNRGIVDAEEARRFLNGSYTLESPDKLLDIDVAVERIRAAVENNERIEIFGDYDVDGITSTALLYEYLESLGADVYCSLPAREGDGYGLSLAVIDRMAQDGVRLIITVDNGISAHEAIWHARELGMDTVVCDHHKVPPELPPAVAVVDPLREGDPSSFKQLAGVGVVLKLVAALEDTPPADLMEQFGAYVALGTVSDVMPLLSENRYIVREGLKNLEQTENYGLLALAKATGADLSKRETRTISFNFAPRLNAAGRMGDATLALELLLTDNPERADELAQLLCNMNAERQKAEREMTDSIEALLAEDHNLMRNPVLLFASETYNSGVSGIVCSRLAEKYGKPVIISSICGDTAKGSGRGIHGISLYNAIRDSEHLLSRFGGHDMAAGFTLDTANLPEFYANLRKSFAQSMIKASFDTLNLEGVVGFEALTESSVEELELLAPCGCANEEPVFATKNVRVVSISRFNERNSRVQLCSHGITVNAAYFAHPPEALCFEVGDNIDVCYSLSIYRPQRGGKVVSIRIRDVRPASYPDSLLQSYSWFVAYRDCGVNAGEEMASIRPDREIVSLVYRELRRRGEISASTKRLAFCFPTLPLGKARAAVEVLLELGFVSCIGRGGNRYYKVDPGAPKRDLAESKFYRVLNGLEDG